MVFANNLIKTKASIQLLLVVFHTLAFSLILAPPALAEQEVCCSETISGEFCSYTEVSNCKDGALQAAASCEQTSFCKLGCGYNQNEGSCFNNLPKFSCEQQEGCSWTADEQCNIPQCQQGCCVLSNQCAYTTQVQCKQITSQFEDINMTFKEDITSEIACLNQCRSFERGACVHEDASCEFTTRESCTEDTPEGTNFTLPLVGFHPERLCSNPSLGTECAPQHHTGCLPDADEVYWMDSCGNPENIYSSDKIASYNSGFVLEKDESCNPSGNNANSESCGNCNYAFGSICAAAQPGVDPVYGDFACKDLVCDDDTVHIDVNTPASANLPLQNGESWCAYDGLVGFEENAGLGLDLAGSRHYRRICINGVELTEPCRDFREELCVQGEIDPNVDPALQLIYGTQESFGRGGVDDLILAGACRENRFEECTKMKTKSDCENLAQRDCLWLLGKENKKPKEMESVACVPLVSPGLKHWSGSSGSTTSSVDPKSTCQQGNTECKVYFHKSGVDRTFGGDWECVGNCECLEPSYLKNANSVCKSLGDCGAWYNIAGEKTCSGFVSSGSNKGNLCNTLPPFGSLQGFTDGSGEATGFSAFWDKGGVQLALGYSVLTAFGYKIFTEATFFSALGAPFSTMGGFLKGSLSHIAKEKALSGAWSAGQEVATKSAAETFGGQFTTTGQIFYTIQVLVYAYMIYQLYDALLADEKIETVTVSCQPWQAPVGGDNCELCQEDGKPCSEYRCKSLGQSCQLINPGTSSEKCISGNVNDVLPPHITVNKERIIQFTDSVDDPSQISEDSGKGFEITEKIAPFTAVTLAIDTNEHAQCKFDINNNVAFDEMPHYFGDSLYELNHTMLFSLPGALAEEDILEITNGGNYQIYVKCQDGNGNNNENDYYAKFAIQDGPDFTPPIIEATSIANGAFVPFGINETDLTIYVNEPSTCKWATEDVDYSIMPNEFTCDQNPFPTTSLYYGLFGCETILTGVEDHVDNDYYFKCEDQPKKPEEERNVNSDGFHFLLKGTNELEILSVFPTDNEELFTNSPTIKVVTSGGAFGNGHAFCGYNFDDPSPESAIEFLNTNSSVHEQPFFNLSVGDYTAYITCLDVAGNLADDTSTFMINVDTHPPQLAQVYTTQGILTIVTDEISTCEYSIDGEFTYGNGIQMTGVQTLEHTASLESDVFYIACIDIFGNIGNFVVYL